MLNLFKSKPNDYAWCENEKRNRAARGDQKTRQHLNRLETQLHRMKYRRVAGTENEEQRIRRLEAEFKRKYPNMEVSRNLLRLVGTEPYNPRSKDKEVIRQIIAERYG